jgi:hypothetical protein
MVSQIFPAQTRDRNHVAQLDASTAVRPLVGNLTLEDEKVCLRQQQMADLLTPSQWAENFIRHIGGKR